MANCCSCGHYCSGSALVLDCRSPFTALFSLPPIIALQGIQRHSTAGWPAETPALTERGRRHVTAAPIEAGCLVTLRSGRQRYAAQSGYKQQSGPLSLLPPASRPATSGQHPLVGHWWRCGSGCSSMPTSSQPAGMAGQAAAKAAASLPLCHHSRRAQRQQQQWCSAYRPLVTIMRTPALR